MCSINHNKKAIFIHIPKNGGSYIANILSKNYGFKNYYLQRPDHIQICKDYDKSVKTHENKIIGTLIYYRTSSYLNKIMNMDNHKWNTYFIFTFIRNPYDRIISGWNYINKYNIQFDNFLNFGNHTNSWDYWHVFMSQYKHIIDTNNKIRANYIGKFENLEDDLVIILKKLGFNNINHNISVKNSKKHDNYKSYYKNNDILNKVNYYINDDLKYFNFTKIEDISLL
jgi:hypothetical protein